MATKDKILVYGAGGVQGGSVARKLLQEGYSVHTIVRSADKATQLHKQGISAFVGDLSDAGSLTSAHDGVSKVFLLLPVDYNVERTRQWSTANGSSAPPSIVNPCIMRNIVS